MNIVVVVFDTLRQDHVGAYGNPLDSDPASRRIRPGFSAVHQSLS